MPDISLIVLVGGVATPGVLCSAYKASRFGATPVAYDTALPSGAADATATSGNAFGGPGQVVLTVPTGEAYWVAIPAGGHIGWVEAPADSLIQGGNTLGAPVVVGALDNEPVQLISNNQVGAELIPLPQTGSAGLQALRLFTTPLEAGKFDIGDFGSVPGHQGVTANDPNASVRFFRADGAGYLSRNASLQDDKTAFTQSWLRDDVTLFSNLIESGAGMWAVYTAPAAANPITWTTALGIELTTGLTGNPVVFLQRTKIGDFTNKATINGGLLELIVPSSGFSTSAPALFIRGRSASPVVVSREAANSQSTLDVIDGPDVNNANYVLFGVDPTGTDVGAPQGGVFISTGANGTGTARDLVLHQYAPKDIVLFTNNVARLRLFGVNTSNQGVGSIKITTATTLPTGNPTGGGLLYVDAGALKYRGSSGTVTTLAIA